MTFYCAIPDAVTARRFSTGKWVNAKIPQAMFRYPHWTGLMIVGIFAGIVQIYVILDYIFPLIDYEIDAVSCVMSTCSEVLAGLYPKLGGAVTWGR